MFYVIHLTILNLFIDSKINLKWSFLPAFHYPLLHTMYVGKTFDGKAKVKTPRWSIWNALILWNSKNTWFCVYENKSYIVASTMTKHADIFGKVTLTIVLILSFCFLASPK